MPANCAEQAPILEADGDVEAARRQGVSSRCAIGAAASASLAVFMLVAGYILTASAQGGSRAVQTSLTGNTGDDIEHITELYSTDCEWIPRDKCFRSDPEKCRCRALWRSGAFRERGFGPCGKEGERDPCLQKAPVLCGPNGLRRLGHHDDPCSLVNALGIELNQSAAKAEAAVEAEGVPAWKNRLASFLVIGDWGWDPSHHGNVMTTSCQTTIADAMLKKMRELGDVKFIINVGDSFYPEGVQGKWDPQWQEKWRDIYPKELRSVPWYSTYGNHDYHKDPGACSEDPADGAQINSDISDRDYFYMPGYNWYKEHPELGLEVVSLDLNQLMDAWNGVDPPIPHDCGFTPCKKKCEKNLKARTKEGVQLFHERANKSSARNMLVFGHYPTDYLWGAYDPVKLMDDLRTNVAADGGQRHITYFGGHRHNVDQDSTESIWPNNNWLVGGGGGWSCDGGSQGFVVGEISKSFELNTYSQLVDWNACCGKAQFTAESV